ncbi:MAG: THUMP domain-containing protein [Candidatus Aenigmatarchaeota archaeon]
MAEANLLVTYNPAHAARAEDEARTLLRSSGEDAKFLESKIEGVFLLRTKKDPREVVRQLAKFGKANPGQFVYTYRWVPIDVWVKTDVAAIGKVMKDFDKKMDPAKSWKMDLVKRHFEKASATDLILKLTEHISKPKVDLKNPQLIIKVEILGKKTGCSLLAADEVLDASNLR